MPGRDTRDRAQELDRAAQNPVDVTAVKGGVRDEAAPGLPPGPGLDEGAHAALEADGEGDAVAELRLSENIRARDQVLESVDDPLGHGVPNNVKSALDPYFFLPNLATILKF